MTQQIPRFPAYPPDCWAQDETINIPRAHLLRALHAFRAPLRELYGALPVPNRDDGGLAPIGALLLLWDRSAYLRGSCPNCASLALGTVIAEEGGQAVVLGRCLGCARGVYRWGPSVDQFFAYVSSCLSDTPYRLLLEGPWWAPQLPTPALLACLQEVGAFGLPPLADYH